MGELLENIGLLLLGAAVMYAAYPLVKKLIDKL